MDTFCKILKGLFVAMLNGAATGASTYIAMPSGGSALPGHQEYKIAGSAAVAGAIFGGISYILRSPWFKNGGSCV